MTPCDWAACQGEQVDSELASDASCVYFVHGAAAWIQQGVKMT